MGVSAAFAKPAVADTSEFQSLWSEIEKGGTQWQSPGIDGHILQPELHIEVLRQSNNAPPVAEQQRLLVEYSSHHSIQRLRRHWLDLAVAQGDWNQALTLYESTDGASAQCAYELARAELGRARLDPIQKLFIQGARGKHCPTLMAMAQERSWISDWAQAERVQKLLAQEQYEQAIALAQSLGPINLARAEQFKLARLNPDRYLQRFPNGRWRSRAIRSEIARDPEGSAQLIQPDEAELWEWRAVHLILDQSPQTQRALEQLRRPLRTQSLREWEVRWHLRQQNWRQVAERIDQMPASLKSDDTWRYWRAMAAEAMGEDASSALKSLASRRSFYGLLAADALGIEYPTYRPVHRDAASVEDLLRRPQIQIAGALFEAGLMSRARSQWRAYWPKLSLAERQAATELAQRWGFASEEVRGAVNSRQTDSLHMYPDALRNVMSDKPIDADWLMGLTRTESLFQTDVRSRAGALGLMQLMPATGEQQARRLGLPWSGPGSLTDPALNITLGADYLHRMYQQFEGNALAATAAYNAGPNAVAKWLTDPALPPAIWIETLPFKETRNYVKKVMYAATVYNQALGSRDRRLSARMTPLPTPNG